MHILGHLATGISIHFCVLITNHHRPQFPQLPTVMASKIVAVASGSSKLGRAIVDELIVHDGYKVLILGRGVLPPTLTSNTIPKLNLQRASDEKSKELGAQVLATNYTSHTSLISILEPNNIDTIISVLSSMAGTDPKLALIAAADASKVTKRYIPSTWGINYTAEVAQVLPLATGKIAAVDALKIWAGIYRCAKRVFMDYFGFPRVKSYLGPFPFVLDIANNSAAIPGSRDVPIVFTYSFNIGRFVTKLLGEGKWGEDSVIIGDKLSWNEFLAIAEEAKCVKIYVKHDSMDMLQQGKVTELYQFMPKEMLQGMANVFEILMEKGHFDLERKGSLNERYAGVGTKSARELVIEA